VDLNKILELLQHYPAWFKWGIAAWVILTALILVGLLILRDAAQNKPVIIDSPPIQAPQPSSVVSKTVEIRVVSPAVPRTHPIKFKEYALRMKALEGRFLERQEFIDSLSNVIVEWEGIVDRVAERRQGEFSYLSMFTSFKIESSISKNAHPAIVPCALMCAGIIIDSVPSRPKSLDKVEL